MNINLVIGRLTREFRYSEYKFEDEELNRRLREHGLEVWKDDKKCMVTKEYSSQTELENWFIDQIIISLIYDSIPSRYKNNLYFLLVVNINADDLKSSLSIINEIEKDNKVCRKYVLENLNDLQRVPSLSQDFSGGSKGTFDFDGEFKNYLFNTEEETDKELSQEMKTMIEVYFKYYDSVGEDVEEVRKKDIENILEKRMKEVENRKVNH